MAFQRNRTFNPLTTESEWKIYAKKSGSRKKFSVKELEVIVRAIGKGGVKSTVVAEDHVSFVLTYTIKRENFLKKFGSFADHVDLISGNYSKSVIPKYHPVLMSLFSIAAFSSLDRDDQTLFDQLSKSVGYVPVVQDAQASTSAVNHEPARKRKRTSYKEATSTPTVPLESEDDE